MIKLASRTLPNLFFVDTVKRKNAKSKETKTAIRLMILIELLLSIWLLLVLA
ncbi:hypothetical protein [Pedobacter sp. NJ-S-72]